MIFAKGMNAVYTYNRTRIAFLIIEYGNTQKIFVTVSRLSRSTRTYECIEIEIYAIKWCILTNCSLHSIQWYHNFCLHTQKAIGRWLNVNVQLFPPRDSVSCFRSYNIQAFVHFTSINLLNKFLGVVVRHLSPPARDVINSYCWTCFEFICSYISSAHFLSHERMIISSALSWTRHICFADVYLTLCRW